MAATFCPEAGRAAPAAEVSTLTLVSGICVNHSF